MATTYATGTIDAAWDALEAGHRGALFTGEFNVATCIERAMHELGPMVGQQVAGTLTGQKITGGLTGQKTIKPAGGTRAQRGGGRTGRSRNGAGGAGGVTGAQLLGWLAQNGPANQTQMAKQFGTTRQTIATRLKALGGQVIKQGAGGNATWAAKTALKAA